MPIQSSAQKPTVICLMGPTASGKTALAIEWAAQRPCTVISVDSALVYRGMDIGTAKPDKEILLKTPHRLIDFLDPSENYSAASFRKDAIDEIEKALQQQTIPLLVGGTMLYYRALQQGLAPLPDADQVVRGQLLIELQQQGLPALYQQLQQVDAASAQRIQATDTQRIQRALEVYRLTGKPLSQLQQQAATIESPYNFVNIGILPADRSILHQRIAQRFQQMLAQGFIDEVAALQARGDLHLGLPSMRAVGYRQIWQYLQGEYDKATMIEKAVAATRQLAKRQLTWLRQWPNLQKPQREIADFV
jgi:tRNA dimethylallyltransferase